MGKGTDMDARQDKQFPNLKPIAPPKITKSTYEIKNNIFIEPKLFYSDAFKSLSRSAILTLLRCLQKRKWVYKKENGRKQVVYLDDGFIFPYAEAKHLGISTTQFWININKLIEVGFLDIVHQGGCYRHCSNEKDYNVYKISERWRAYNTKYFQPVSKARVLDPAYHIRKNLERKKTKAPSQE
jgi:hypothetical protein